MRLFKRYFSKIALKTGIYQTIIKTYIDIKELSLSFWKIWFNRIPFNKGNAFKFFHSIIQESLETIENITAFVHDTITFTRFESEHLKILTKVLEVLSWKNIVLNPLKCIFFKKTINYLGFKFSEKGIFTRYPTIRKFLRVGNPNNQNTIQTLPGKIYLYRIFIP